MFTKSSIESKLDAEIISLLDKMESTPDKNSEEYGALVDRVSKLQKLKADEKPRQLSPDTMLVVAANVFGILWLARYERENVIKAPNAMKFVMKPK